MAKKNLAGQINMFDVFRELENSAETAGDVEMVSLMPEAETVADYEADGSTVTTAMDALIVSEHAIAENTMTDKLDAETEAEPVIHKKQLHGKDGYSASDIAMHREKLDADGNIVAEISYINYNKVLIRRKGYEDILKAFDSSYDAVDYYVANMKLDDF